MQKVKKGKKQLKKVEDLDALYFYDKIKDNKKRAISIPKIIIKQREGEPNEEEEEDEYENEEMNRTVVFSNICGINPKEKKFWKKFKTKSKTKLNSISLISFGIKYFVAINTPLIKILMINFIININFELFPHHLLMFFSRVYDEPQTEPTILEM